MSEYTEKATGFLKQHGINFVAVKIDYGPYFPEDKESRGIYRLELRRASYKRGKFAPTSGPQRVSFRFGASLHDTERGEAPTAYDLLAGLTKQDPGTFGNFCGDFGYNEDSRKAEKVYKAVIREWAKVSRFFTAAELEELQDIN